MTLFRKSISISITLLILNSCMNKEVFQALDSPISSKGMAVKKKLWKTGQTIKIAFINGTDFEKETVIVALKSWEKFANLNFDIYLESLGKGYDRKFKKDTIRFKFDSSTGGGQSPVGKDVNGIFGMKLSTTIGTKFSPRNNYRVAVHEIGHALGLLHEHMHPDSLKLVSKEDRKKLCKTQGWSWFTCRINTKLKKAKKKYNLSVYDKDSVMHYSIGEVKSKMNGVLSLGDKKFIADLYPFSPKLNNRDFYDLSLENRIERIKWEKEVIQRNPTFNRCEIVADNGMIEDSLSCKRIHFSHNLIEYDFSKCHYDLINAYRVMSAHTFCKDRSPLNTNTNKCRIVPIYSGNKIEYKVLDNNFNQIGVHFSTRKLNDLEVILETQTIECLGY